MNREAIADEVIRLLRRTLSGSSRDIGLNEPLGELGLGLDSLTLIEFVTVLENRFQVVIPESIWTEKGQLVLNHFVDVIAESRSATAADPAAAPVMTTKDETVLSEATAPVLPVTPAPVQPSWLDGIRRHWHSLYQRETFFILEFDLRKPTLPSYVSPLPLLLRRATEKDGAALETFWNSSPYFTIDKQEMTMALFQQRLRSGYTCLLAWHGDVIVGMDWLLEKGYDCPYTGLRFEWPAGSCYAGELSEHASFKGKGVGLSLLAYSLAECKQAGFQRQVAWVTEKNVKMLSASIQLFGFIKIGEIHIRRIHYRPFSTWRIGDRHGRGGTIII